MEMTAKIAEDLLPLAFPIDELRLLPDNTRRGDVDSVAAAYHEFGQRKPIVARKEQDGSGVVLAGNTQLRAARKLGWTHIAVSWADDLTEDQASGYALADNRTHDLGEYIPENVVKFLKEVESEDSIFDATGYTIQDLQEFEDEIALSANASFEPIDTGLPAGDEDEDDEPTPVESVERAVGQPVIQYAIIFDTEEQQQRWYTFVRWLRKNVEGDTVASRLDAFLADVDMDEQD